MIHHGRTFRHDHVTQFRSDADQAELDRALVVRDRAWVIRVRYGLITDTFGALCYVVLPASAAVVICYGVSGMFDTFFLVAAAVPVLSTPLLSIFFHPYLHLSTERAAEVAPLPARWLLKTRFGLWARIMHFVHHREPRVNFNLLPGGDILLQTFRFPTAREIAEMRRIGLLTATEAASLSLPERLSTASEESASALAPSPCDCSDERSQNEMAASPTS